MTNERFAEYAVNGAAGGVARDRTRQGGFVAGRGDRHDTPGAAKGAAGQGRCRQPYLLPTDCRVTRFGCPEVGAADAGCKRGGLW